MFAPLRELGCKLKGTVRWIQIQSLGFSDSSTSTDDEAKLLENKEIFDSQDLENQPDSETRPSKLRLFFCITANVVSTVSIVFTNKYIFSNENLRNCQMGFASYHFTITAVTLWFLSQPSCGIFEPKSIPVRRNLHLVVLMCTQVILQNLSLAYSSVIFHQLIRILLTPVTAILGFVLYRAAIPKTAILPLAISCGGIGIVFYFNPASATNTAVTTTSKGVIFASVGLFASALYTSLVGRYQKRLQVSSMQLLLNQAPVSAGLLLCMAPFLDETPATTSLSPSLCIAIFMSGLLACLVNVSQFLVIDAVGPVGSTVIGHLKTCTIVGLGWLLSDQPISKQSVVGIFMALLGMGLYMAATLKARQ